MTLLIDGHNLINALPDLSLDDPNDEAKLVERLKSYCARTGKRCTVVFDRGLPGGPSRDLSTSQVKVVFASAGYMSADQVLIGRMRKLKDPANYLVVSSDREVLREAEGRRIRTRSSEAFAADMQQAMAAGLEEDRSGDVHLSDEQIDEWMRLFARKRKNSG